MKRSEKIIYDDMKKNASDMYYKLKDIKSLMAEMSAALDAARTFDTSVCDYSHAMPYYNHMSSTFIESVKTKFDTLEDISSNFHKNIIQNVDSQSADIFQKNMKYLNKVNEKGNEYKTEGIYQNGQYQNSDFSGNPIGEIYDSFGKLSVDDFARGKSSELQSIKSFLDKKAAILKENFNKYCTPEQISQFQNMSNEEIATLIFRGSTGVLKNLKSSKYEDGKDWLSKLEFGADVIFGVVAGITIAAGAIFSSTVLGTIGAAITVGGAIYFGCKLVGSLLLGVNPITGEEMSGTDYVLMAGDFLASTFSGVLAVLGIKSGTAFKVFNVATNIDTFTAVSVSAYEGDGLKIAGILAFAFAGKLSGEALDQLVKKHAKEFEKIYGKNFDIKKLVQEEGEKAASFLEMKHLSKNEIFSDPKYVGVVEQLKHDFNFSDSQIKDYLRVEEIKIYVDKNGVIFYTHEPRPDKPNSGKYATHNSKLDSYNFSQGYQVVSQEAITRLSGAIETVTGNVIAGYGLINPNIDNPKLDINWQPINGSLEEQKNSFENLMNSLTPNKLAGAN